MLPKKIKFQPHNKNPSKLPTLTSHPQPDLCINIQNKLIPVHRSKLRESELVSRDVGVSQKILIIIQQIDIRILSQVIAFYYGYEFEIVTLDHLQKLLEVVSVLKIKAFTDQISEGILDRVQEYDTIALFRLAYRYELQDVLEMCLCYLEQEQFQQVRINKYSLYQCQFILFQLLIRRHHRLKMINKINGLPLEVIQDVISTYCRRHYYDKQTQIKLYAKYVDPWRPQKKQIIQINKGSLRLNKLPMKNIGQSISLYGTDSEKREKQELSITTPSSGQFNFLRKPQSLHRRKYSIEADRELESMGLSSPKKKNSCKEIETMVFVSDIKTYFQQEDEIVIPQSKKQYMESSKSKNDSQARKQEKFIEQYLSVFQINEIAKILDNSLEDQPLHMKVTVRNGNAKSMIFPDVIQQDDAQSYEEVKKPKTFKKIPRFSEGAQLFSPYN